MGKKELERLKLELEIKDLKKRWYSDAEIWKTVIPTLAIIASLYFTFGQGILDSQKSKLELEKSQLELDISKFETKRDNLLLSIEDKDSIRIELEKQIFEYDAQRKNLISQIGALKSKIGLKDKLVENVNNEKLKDKKFYQNKLLNQLKSEKANQKEFIKLRQTIGEHLVTIAEMKAEKDYLKKKVNLTPIEENQKDIEITKARIAELNKSRTNFEALLKESNEKYEKEKKRIEKLSADDLVREFEILLLDME